MRSLSMKLLELYLIVALIAIISSSAIPKPGEEHKNPVHEQVLHDMEHDRDSEHHSEYDHEAFLGKDDAKTFDQLTPEESKERLAIIVDKIDKDKNGEVTEQELKEWVQYVQKRYVVTDTERMWKDHDTADDKLTWNSYKKRTYGYEDEPDNEDSPTFSYKDMIERDDRRWKVADKNKDGFLDKEEFADFLHPEEAEHMRDIVVQETMEDIDKNKDGFISLEEYIADVYDEDEDEDEADTVPDDDHRQDGEPDWVKSEREQFKNHRDKNLDGKLDRDEVREWVIPDDYDHSGAEARHLVEASDLNKDGKLSKEEILEHYDLFVGSQATDFGEALTRHDEF